MMAALASIERSKREAGRLRKRARSLERCPLKVSEIEVVHWLSMGKTSAEMAEILGTSPHAIERRLDLAWDRTGTKNRHGLVALALRKGWIE